jgi:hypothetical protein
MSTLYTINVTNKSQYTQDFYFFQRPAVYIGGTTVYSNSIYHSQLRSYSESGAMLTFKLLQQYYAGVQDQAQQIVVGQASGYTTASQPIDLTTSSGSTNNCTTMQIDPLGLTPPAYVQGVQNGAFRIITSEFNPVTNKYNAGLAVQNQTDGSIVLSNFINVQPNINIDVQPVLIFYVQIGSYQAGSVVNFTTSSVGAAVCDTTQGTTTFNVTYEMNGSWSVDSSAKHPGLTQLIQAAPNNVEIKNEAGTAVISTGLANNLNPPFLVSNLSNPNNIVLHSEYQVRLIGGSYKGYMCTVKQGNTATFA